MHMFFKVITYCSVIELNDRTGELDSSSMKADRHVIDFGRILKIWFVVVIVIASCFLIGKQTRKSRIGTTG